MDYAFYNGLYTEYGEMKIPLRDRSIYFGDGVYDCMIGGAKGVYQLSLHIERLRKNAELLSLSLPYSDGELSDIINRLVTLSSLDEYTVYIQLSRVSERRSHACSDFGRSSLLVTVTETAVPREYETASLISLEDVRYKMCNVKTLNLLPAVLASERAERDGHDEAVFVRDGTVTECAHSNIFAFIGGKLVTHPESRYILPGITRRSVLLTARNLGIRCEERCFTLDELLESDGAFITSTTRLVRGVDSVDGIPISSAASPTVKRIFLQILSDYLVFCC